MQRVAPCPDRGNNCQGQYQPSDDEAPATAAEELCAEEWHPKPASGLMSPRTTEAPHNRRTASTVGVALRTSSLSNDLPDRRSQYAPGSAHRLAPTYSHHAKQRVWTRWIQTQKPTNSATESGNCPCKAEGLGHVGDLSAHGTGQLAPAAKRWPRICNRASLVGQQTEQGATKVLLTSGRSGPHQCGIAFRRGKSKRTPINGPAFPSRLTVEPSKPVAPVSLQVQHRSERANPAPLRRITGEVVPGSARCFLTGRSPGVKPLIYHSKITCSGLIERFPLLGFSEQAATGCAPRSAPPLRSAGVGFILGTSPRLRLKDRSVGS